MSILNAATTRALPLRRRRVLAAVLLIAVAVLAGADNPGSTTWRGLVVAAEVECMDYAGNADGAAGGGPGGRRGPGAVYRPAW